MAAYAEGSLWYYAPNKVAPIVFCVLFAISVCLHAFQNRSGTPLIRAGQFSKYHWWKPLFVLVWAGIVNIAGLAMREVGAFHYDNLGVYIASGTLLFAGPPIYAAANYIILGRVLYYIPYLAPIHPGRVLTTFLGLDVVIETLTINGMTLLTNSSESRKTISTGGALVKAGILLQIGTSLLFVGTTALFHRRCRRHGLCGTSTSTSTATAKLRRVLWTLYASTGLIVVRSVYAVVVTFETLSDSAATTKFRPGPFVRSEVPFYVMDVAVMLVNTYLLNVFHPARYLPRNHKMYLAKDGRTELLGPGFMDRRPLIVTLLDPFDVVGLVTGRDKKEAFWDQPQQGAGAETARDEEVVGRKC